MDALLRRLARAALRRGVAGEHWAWLVLAFAAFILRRVRRAQDDPILLNLKPGESYVVRLSDPGGSPSVSAEGVGNAD